MSSFPIVSTRDPDEAEFVLSRELVDLHFEKVQEPKSFGLKMNGVHLNDTLVGYNSFNTDTVVDGGEVEDAIIVVVGVGQPTTTYIDGNPVLCTKRAPILAPTRRVVHHRPAGGGLFILRAEHQVLEQRLRAALDRDTKEPIRFDTSLDLDSCLGRHFLSLISHLVGSAERDTKIFENPLLRASYDELVLNTLLTLPSNYSQEITCGRAARIAPAMVHRAEAFLEANASEPVTIDNLVVECGCSRRALFNAFQESRGYTPMQFLKECRLKLAHKALQSATPEETVTSIGYSCGFPHPSRFADTYQKRFGERPSQTLRNRPFTTKAS